MLQVWFLLIYQKVLRVNSIITLETVYKVCVSENLATYNLRPFKISVPHFFQGILGLRTFINPTASPFRTQLQRERKCSNCKYHMGMKEEKTKRNQTKMTVQVLIF